MKKVIAIMVLAILMNSFSSPSQAGQRSSYASNETCEQQVERTVQRALPNIEAMCATTENPMQCVIASMEAMKKELIEDCKKDGQ